MRPAKTERPIRKPSGMPTKAARPKPNPTRSSELSTCQPMPTSLGPLTKKGSENSSSAALQVAPGVGNWPSPPLAAKCHRPMSSSKPNSGGTTWGGHALTSQRGPWGLGASLTAWVAGAVGVWACAAGALAAWLLSSGRGV